MAVRVLLTVSFAFLAAIVAGVTAGSIEAGGGGHTCRDKPVAGSGNQVLMSGSCFFPTVLQVETGTTVQWTNREAMTHDVRPIADPALFTDGGSLWTLNKDESAWAAFSEEGIYAYFCRLHPGMVGVIAVGEAGVIAQTGDFKVTRGARPAADPVSLSKVDAASPAYPQTAPPALGAEHVRTPETSWLAPMAGFAIGLVVAGSGFGLASRLRRG